jgi:hypothetical protein
MIISFYKTAGQNLSVMTVKWGKVEALGMTVTNSDDIRDPSNRTLNTGNASYFQLNLFYLSVSTRIYRLKSTKS